MLARFSRATALASAFSLFLVFNAPAAMAATARTGVRNTSRAFLLPQPRASEFAAQTLLTPSEFARASELQMTEETFRRIESAIVGTVDQVVDLVVMVDSASSGTALVNEFRSMGGNTSRLRTMVIATDSFWYQDYGPIYSVDPSGQLVSNDFIYDRFGRRNDDAVPAKLAKAQGVANRKVSMDYEGGNFISDGKGTCFASTRMYEQNPQLSTAQVNSLMQANLGCFQMVTLTPLVDDDTYHIDLFAKMVGDKTFIVGDFVDHPQNKQIMDENAKTLQGLGYKVVRIPVRNPSYQNYLSHLNSFLVNGYAILPDYGVAEDDIAQKAYESLGYKVLRVDTTDLESTGGAIHCIMRSKPAL